MARAESFMRSVLTLEVFTFLLPVYVADRTADVGLRRAVFIAGFRLMSHVMQEGVCMCACLSVAAITCQKIKARSLEAFHCF
jgi:hypothetical protein